MKKKYIKLLEELKSEFQGKDEALKAIQVLKSTVESYNWPKKNETQSSSQFPLPVEMNNGKESYALFSDGACRGNPGPGSWGMMAQDVTGKLIFHSSGVDTHTTNNRMELEGAIQALDFLIQYFSDNDLGDNANVYLYSDSKYVVDGMMKWVAGWKKRGWKKADNKKPENVELWMRLDELSLQFDHLKYIWVKGHAGHPQNEYCDQLANQALDDLGI